MSEQKRLGTAPEIALRKLLFAQGLRYRVGYKVPGMPRRTIDIAFPKQKVAVFIDGCFWHGCPEHCVPPKNNAEWWANKLDGNIARDEGTTDHLVASGWTVVRLWEHLSTMEMLPQVVATLTPSGSAAHLSPANRPRIQPRSPAEGP